MCNVWYIFMHVKANFLVGIIIIMITLAMSFRWEQNTLEKEMLQDGQIVVTLSQVISI